MSNHMVHFHTDLGCFNYRVAAVIMRNDEVLLFYFDGPKFWSLPGGRCDMLEDSKTAIIRECQEELSVKVEPTTLLAVVENFFTFADEQTQELLFIYKVEVAEDEKIMQVSEFYGDEAGKPMLCKWVKISELADYKIMPILFQSLLKKLPDTTKHIIYYDGKPI